MIELQHLKDIGIDIMPIVLGTLGSISDAHNSYLSLLQITDISVHQLQKTVLF